MNNKLQIKFKNIKLLAMDFDGVMTDGSVYVGTDGREMVKCSRKDGLGIEMLKRRGIKIIVISKEANPVVSARCKKLKISCWQKVENGEGKLAILKRVIKENNISLDKAAYIGDDLNDIEVLQKVGLAITVADGHLLVKKVCDYATKAKGGRHAVREVCEKIITAQGAPLIF